MPESYKGESELLETVQGLYRRIALKLIDSGKTVSTMESCTSGLIASLLTDTEGASAYFCGGLTAYSNEQKILFGLPKEILDRYTVYSEETARAMAQLARKVTDTDIGIGVTGCFGRPDPSNESGVPGEVYFCIDSSRQTLCDKISLEDEGSRFHSKLQTARAVGECLMKLEKES